MCEAFFLDMYSSQLLGLLSTIPCPHHLEAEDLVLELADGPGLGEAERLSSLLHGTDHRRRAADENFDVRCRSGKKVLL